MAEFKDIVQGFNRMCDSYNTPPCEGCPMDIHSIDRSDCMSRLFAKPDKYEGRVLKWIEKHPAPVYPTWLELAAQQGFKIEEGKQCTNEEQLLILLMASVNTPIPADIAQKLGIEPREE